MTFGALPDDVLLETFEIYVGKHDLFHSHPSSYDKWQTLVHVCRRWRYIVFASPCRLNLKLCCTPQRSVNSKTLDIWPELPIVIFAKDLRSKEEVTNVMAALRHHNRVCECKINYQNRQFQASLLKEFAAIDDPFPSLTSLDLTSYAQNAPVFPDSFLGGSAPHLRSLWLFGIPYPSIGTLLSSTTNLVTLYLWGIPHSGYISPETIVPILSMLLRLESLDLGFKCPRSRAHQPIRHPPPLTRVAFPNLTGLFLHGEIEYFEYVLSQIETPVLNRIYICFFNRLVFDTPLLGHFIRRTAIFTTTHTARVTFYSSDVEVILLGQEEIDSHGGLSTEPLRLRVPCKPFDWQLSAVAQVLNSLLSSLPTLETLEISVDRGDWQGDIEVTQLQEFLHLFTSVKEMTLVREDSVQLVAPALRELARERPTEVLPTLQILYLPTYGWQSSGPVEEAIKQFIVARDRKSVV